jgi:hypothetical protein
VVIATHPDQALRLLDRAYISGDLDIEGDLTDGLRRVWGALRDAPARGLALAPAAVATVKAVAQLKLQVRVWRLYLAGGALAFEEGRMGVDQILARRPQR